MVRTLPYHPPTLTRRLLAIIIHGHGIAAADLHRLVIAGPVAATVAAATVIVIVKPARCVLHGHRTRFPCAADTTRTGCHAGILRAALPALHWRRSALVSRPIPSLLLHGRKTVCRRCCLLLLPLVVGACRCRRGPTCRSCRRCRRQQLLQTLPVLPGLRADEPVECKRKCKHTHGTGYGGLRCHVTWSTRYRRASELMGVGEVMDPG